MLKPMSASPPSPFCPYCPVAPPARVVLQSALSRFVIDERYQGARR